MPKLIVKYLALFAFFLVFILAVSQISQAYATFTYKTWTQPTYYSNDDVNTETLALSNGKTLKACMEFTAAATARLDIRQYGATGILDAHYTSGTYTGWPSATMLYNEQAAKVRIIAITTYQAIIVFTQSYAEGSYTYWEVNALLWNGNTGSISGTISNLILKQVNDGGYHAPIKVSSIGACLYGVDPYFVVLGNSGFQVNAQYMAVFYYSVVGTALYLKATTTLGSTASNNQEPAQLFLTQNSTSTDQVYVVTSRPDLAVTQPVYYRIDLDDGSLEVLYTGSVGYWSTNYYMWLIGAGEVSDSGSAYLYFNIAMPFLSGTSRRYWIYQQVLKFTGTITLAHFSDSHNLLIDLMPMLAAGTELSWIIGYTLTYNSFRVIFPEASGGTYYSMYCDITVSNFFDFGSAAFSEGTWTLEPSIPVSGDNDKVGWASGSYSMVCINYGSGLIFYGITPQSSSFAISNSWTPVDNPLLTNQKYTFSVLATLNGYAWQGKTIAVYLDSIQIVWKIPNSAGVITYDHTFAATGIYNLTVRLYDVISGLVYTKSENLIVITGAPTTGPGSPGPSTPGYMLPGYFEVFTALFPAFLVIGIPAISIGSAGAKAGVGQMGFIFGALLGIGLGYGVGVIPPAVFYMVVLFVAIMLIMVVRSKFSGDGGGG